MKNEWVNKLPSDIYISFFWFFTFVTSVSYNFFFLNNSQALRGANVQGTQNVLLFACTSKIKPLHYIRYVSFLTSCLNHYSMLWETLSSTYCAKLSQGVVFFVARMLFFRMDCPTVLKMQIWCNMHRNLRMGELSHTPLFSSAENETYTHFLGIKQLILAHKLSCVSQAWSKIYRGNSPEKLRL